MHLRHPVADRRIAEHVGAVAERGDDQLVGRGELGAERGAEAPAEAAGRAERIEGAGLLARAVIGAQRIFIEDDGVLADAFADAAREIFRRDAVAGGGILRELGAAIAHALGQSAAPRGNARFRHLQPLLDRAPTARSAHW